MSENSHYSHYPDIETNALWAYGFRSFFLFLIPYMVLLGILWPLLLINGVAPTSRPFIWHAYEYLYGIGYAGIAAFMLTALPELYSSEVPIVGKKLKNLIILWLSARVLQWSVDMIGHIPAFLANILFSITILVIIFKAVVLDKKQTHASLGYIILFLTIIQLLYYLSMLKIISLVPIELMKVALSLFLVLILLALRRVNIEAVNQVLKFKNIDEIFITKAFRYNFSIFCVLLYAFCEYYSPNETLLAWIGIACFFANINILNDYKLKDFHIFNFSLIPYLCSIPILIALGYLSMSFSILLEAGNIAHLRHILTTGAFSVTFYIVFHIVTYVHTGRTLVVNKYLFYGFTLLILATFVRSFTMFYHQFTYLSYFISSLFWSFAFTIFFIGNYKKLISPRVDGLKG